MGHSKESTDLVPQQPVWWMVINKFEVLLALTDPLQPRACAFWCFLCFLLPYTAIPAKATKCTALQPGTVQLLEIYGYFFLCFCYAFKPIIRAVSKTFNHSYPYFLLDPSVKYALGCSYKYLQN